MKAPGAAQTPMSMKPVIAPGEGPPATAVDPKDAAKECQTYRDYIASTAREEASAADLNSGMLAEARSGGAACESKEDGAAGRNPSGHQE